MKHCTKCGGEIEDTAKFCTWCGAAVPVAAASVAAAAVTQAVPKPATYEPPVTGTYQAPAASVQAPVYGQPYGTQQTGTYQTPAATYEQPTTTVTVNYGQPTNTYGQPYTGQQAGGTYPSAASSQKDTLGTVAIVFMGIAAVVALINGFAYLSYGGDYTGVGIFYFVSLLWIIPLTIVLAKKIREKAIISTGFKVVCLIFGSLITGIVLFIRDSQKKQQQL